MAVTVSSMAKIGATAAMAGIKTDASQDSVIKPKSKEETKALAIGKAAESNIIGQKKKKKGPLLEPQTYNKMGQLARMTALKQAGSSAPKGGFLSKKV